MEKMCEIIRCLPVLFLFALIAKLPVRNRVPTKLIRTNFLICIPLCSLMKVVECADNTVEDADTVKDA